MPDVFAISEITAHIRHLLETDAALQDVWVQGEVSNFKRAASGHWYFTLKDSKAQLRCVMWRSSAARQSVLPADGDNIIVHGSMGVYDQRGDYQLYADFIRAAGVGDLYAQFEQLKAQLDAEGLFDAMHKKQLPSFPLGIGVVTSADAAALQDVLNVLERRFPIARLILSTTLVQGNEAPAQIARAVQLLDESGLVDVMLIVRGGGSIEDLWAFNSEQVARTVFDAHTPIISGVGHETDFTIIDFVADHRAPTPSAAAEVATPDVVDIRYALQEMQSRLSQSVQQHLSELHGQVQIASKTLSYLSPAADVRNYRQQVDNLNSRLIAVQKQQLKQLKERLQTKHAALEAANPDAILKRGYAIVREPGTDKIIPAAANLSANTPISITFADGDVNATTEE